MESSWNALCSFFLRNYSTGKFSEINKLSERSLLFIGVNNFEKISNEVFYELNNSWILNEKPSCWFTLAWIMRGADRWELSLWKLKTLACWTQLKFIIKSFWLFHSVWTWNRKFNYKRSPLNSHRQLEVQFPVERKIKWKQMEMKFSRLN